jgi:hypothetical protein
MQSRAEVPKKTKKEVNYSKGYAPAHCGICTHYSAKTCELVAGKIDPSMWCKLFEKKK